MSSMSNVVVEISNLPPPVPTTVAVLESFIAQTVKWRQFLSDLSPHVRSQGRSPLRRMEEAQMQELAALTTQLEAAKDAALAADPEPTYEELAALEDEMDEDALMAGEATKTIEAVCELDCAFASALLEKQRHYINEHGCWLSRNSPGHKNGYQKFNFRNTKNPATGENIGLSLHS
ncbi:hypothetical protein ESCO_004077 [Escovopsis weberi]|uniref:Uncharacterized protein n=1 Tax=Escovopsis weberi TaxID=150374 RepID=A0A0M8MX45_ESCWE|nr:hypothetical protein ESCO_004077 [Escovopsis weberi]